MSPSFLKSLTIIAIVLAAFAKGAVDSPLTSSTSSKNLRSRISIKTSPAAIDLGGCAAFAVLAGSSATFNGALTTITSGDIGTSPGSSIAGTYQLDDGTVEINSSAANTCASDKTTAYNAAAASVCPAANQVSELSGLTLIPGVYCAPSGGMSLSAGAVTLDAVGDASSVWIFQMASDLYTAANTQFTLANGALATNVFWQVGSSATIGPTTTFVGSILAYQSISVDESANISGRALAGAKVSFAGNDDIAVPPTA